MFKSIFKEMFHPSKAAIIESLKRSNGLPVSEIANEVEMSYMGVKQHCKKLEAEGFVESWRVPRKTVGRPEKLYRLTAKSDELFPQAGYKLTLSLLESVKMSYGESAPEKLLVHYFNSLEEEWSKKIQKETSVLDKSVKLAELREAEGCFNKVSYSKASGVVINEYHNPMAVIYHEYPAVERFEREMFESLIGAPVSKEIVEGAHGQALTVYKIATLGATAGKDAAD